MSLNPRRMLAALAVALVAVPLLVSDGGRWLVRAASQGGEVGARYAALAVTWPLPDGPTR